MRLCALFVIIYFSIQLSTCNCAQMYKFQLGKVEQKLSRNDSVIFDFYSFKYNRTSMAMNVTLDVMADLNHAQVLVEIFEFLNNEYRPFAIKFKREACNFLYAEYALIYADVAHDGHADHFLPPKCPVKQGHYYFTNYMPNADNFPALPMKNFYMKISLILDNVEHYHTKIYIIADRDALFRDKFG